MEEAAPVVEFTISFGDDVSVLRVPLDKALATDADEALLFEDADDLGFPGPSRRERRKRRRGATADPDAMWVSPGQAVTVGGHTISVGMVYVGTDLGPASEERHWWLDLEPALIDPRLEVSPVPERVSDAETYPLTYESLSPSQRAGYLSWLAGGRRDSDVAPIYLQLFMYGVERRLIADVERSQTARADAAEIVEEVNRLRELHSQEWKFSYHATAMLEALKADQIARCDEPLEPPRESAGWQIPLVLRVGLGRLAAKRAPVSADWALSWLFCSPEAYLRTPAKRCRNEFEALFRDRYSEHHGEGFVIRPLKRKIAVEYRPQNPGLDRWLEVKTDIPDVAESAPLADKLRELARLCCDELDAYSRFVGRHPDRIDDLAAIALLPSEVLARTGGCPVRRGTSRRAVPV